MCSTFAHKNYCVRQTFSQQYNSCPYWLLCHLLPPHTVSLPRSQGLLPLLGGKGSWKDKIPCRVYVFIETTNWDAGPNQAQSLPYNTIGRSRAKWWTIPLCWASSFHPLLMSTQISQRWPKESCLFVCIWLPPECYFQHILHLGFLQFDCDNHCANMAQDRSESQVPSALTSDVTRLLPCWCDEPVPSSELLCVVYWICWSQETPFARIIWVHFHSRRWLCIQVDMKPTPSDQPQSQGIGW